MVRMDNLALLQRLKDLRGNIAGIKNSIPSNPENQKLRDDIDDIDKAVTKVMKKVVTLLKDDVDVL
jgi:DNA-binding FrmR family transcriptional regulator